MLGGNRLWRNWDFIKLWGGQTVSVVGSQVTVLALPTIAILQLHASAFQVGLLTALQRLAFPILALFAGVVVDRLRRRPLMIAADTMRGVAIVSIPVVAAVGALSLLQLYTVAFVLGIGTVLFDIAYLAYVPSLVGRAEILEANTKLEITHSASNLAGPSLGGLLIQLVGAAQAMVADAVSFFVSVATIVWIRKPEPEVDTAVKRGSVLADIRDGIQLVARDPILRSLAIFLTFGAIGFHLQDPALYLFAYRNVFLTPGQLGLVFAAGGAGAVIGAFIVGWVVRRLGVGGSLSASNVLVGFAFGAWPIASVGHALIILCVLTCIGGIADSVYNVGQVSLRQAVTPDHMQGRMTATLRTLFWGAWPLANFAGGIVAGQAGAPATIVIGSVLALAANVVVFAGPLGRIRSHDDVAQLHSKA